MKKQGGGQLVFGKHRNAALAERHRRSIEKKLGMEVEITARRNSRGEISQRGRFFTFQGIPPDEKDFEDLTLEEYERYMDVWEGDIDVTETQGSGDYGEEG